MPNYKTHDRIAVIGAGLAMIANYFAIEYTNVSASDSLFIGAAILINSYYLSPDLDIASEPFNRWKKLRILWIPYQKLIKHRHWLSHSGPLSYSIRLVYILFIPLIWLLIWPQYIPPEVYYYLLLFWIGGCISDTLHWLADVVVKK